MHNIKKVTVLIISLLLLFSCGQTDKQIDDAKKDMLWSDNIQTEETKNADSIVTEVEDKENQKNVEEESLITIEYIGSDKFIEISKLNEDWIDEGEVDINWSAVEWIIVDKIIVDFKNESSEFKDDTYQLKKFKKWWTDFKYLASSRFQVLDFWKNIYTFNAYSEDKISKVIVTINVLNEDEKKKIEEENTREEKLIWTEDDTVFLNLPVWDNFWKPILLWEDVFTYSLINWLEIIKRNKRDITCENVTDLLSEEMSGWYYWNTCRDIIKDKWISFFVVRLDGDNYFYEKHYIDFKYWFYWVLELEKWEWVTKDNIKEKNSELKEWNDYKIGELTDDLFKKILK